MPPAARCRLCSNAVISVVRVRNSSCGVSSAPRFFARTPAKIRRIVRICDVDRYLQKSFSFFLRIFSTSGSMLLSSRAL